MKMKKSKQGYFNQNGSCYQTIVHASEIKCKFSIVFKIVKWAEQFFPGAEHEKLPSQECVLKTLSACYYLDCLKPFKNPGVLPTTNLEFDVITHDFISSVFSLLTDESLMQLENLIFHDWQKPAAAFTLIRKVFLEN